MSSNGIMSMLMQGKGACLRQCAWLLQLAALQLHRADLAVLAHREDCKRLLTALFDAAPADPTTGTANASAYSSVVQILQSGTYTLAEPQLSSHVPAHARKRLNLSAVLGSPEVLQPQAEHGRPRLDVGALAAALQQRYRELEQESRRYPGGVDAAALSELRDACAGAMRYAQEFNAYADESEGQAALIIAWQCVVEVTFTRRYEVLDNSSQSLRGGAQSIARDLLEATLEVTAGLLAADFAQLTPPLCQVIRVLVVRLQQQAIGWTSGSATHGTGFGSQAQTHALLKQLLLLLRLGSKRDAVRAPLLDALLSYLQACRGPRIAHASADLFQAALSGPSGTDSAAVSQLDAAQAELEAGNAALLQGAPFLVEMLALQAAAPGMQPVRRTQALTVLLALVRADTGATTLETLQASGLLGSLLQDLTSNARADLLKVPPKSRAALQVNEARLALLLQAVRTSLQMQSSSHSFRLAAVDITAQLARCQAVDLQPEEPATVSQHSAHVSLRERLLRFNVAVLRIVAAACAGLPDSKQMRTAAAAFVEAHHAALERMLRDVGTPGAPGRGAWQPGETDLEAAALVLQLLQWLVPHHKQHRTGAVQDLWSKAYVLAERFMAHEPQRQSPVLSQVVEVSEAHVASLPMHARRKLSRLAIQVRSVQRGVTALLEALVHHGLAELPMARQPGSPASMPPSLMLLKDLLIQVSDSLVSTVDRRRKLMGTLMQPDGRQPADSMAIQVHSGQQSDSMPSGSAGREASVLELADLDREVGMLQHTAECALAVTFLQLRKGTSEGGSPEAHEQLQRSLLPVLHQLESLDEGTEQAKARDWSSLQMLARRTKNQLVL